MIAVEMEMPSACSTCPLNNDYNRCVVTDNSTFPDIMRPRWCPLHDIDVERDGTIHISKD